MKFAIATTALVLYTNMKVSLATLPQLGTAPATDIVGNSFKLHEEDPLGVGLSSGISGVFKDLTSCIERRDASGDPGRFSLTTSLRDEDHARTTSAELGIRGGGVASGFAVSGTLDSGWSQTTGSTLDTYRSSLDVYNLNEHFEFTDSQECRNEDSLDEHFLTEFAALPVGDRFNPRTESSWSSYASFMNEYGSHVLTQATTGSRFTRVSKTEDTTATNIESFTIRACAEAQSLVPPTGGGNATTVAGCATGGTNSSSFVHTHDASFNNYALGGAPNSPSKTEITTLNVIPGLELLNEFIGEAAESVTPVKYKFEPIWEILNEVYNTPCLASEQNQDDENCRMLQRAATLQAYYEGKLAYQCDRQTTPNFGVIQEMIYTADMGGYEADLATGVQFFGCWNRGTGCHSDDDCGYGNSYLPQCLMYGEDAVSYEDIPFSETGASRNVVIETWEDAPAEPTQRGNDWCSWWLGGCVCRTARGWNTGVATKSDRVIYVQTLTGSAGATTEQVDMMSKNQMVVKEDRERAKGNLRVEGAVA